MPRPTDTGSGHVRKVSRKPPRRVVRVADPKGAVEFATARREVDTPHHHYDLERARQAGAAHRLARDLVGQTTQVKTKNEGIDKALSTLFGSTPLGNVLGDISPAGIALRSKPVRNARHATQQLLELNPVYKQLTKELTGTGLHTKGLHALAQLVVEHGALVPTSTGQPLVKTRRGSIVPRGAATVEPPKIRNAPLPIQNAFREFFDIPGEAIPGTYHTFEPLARGDVREAGKRLSDPYVQLAHDPVKQLHDHPLTTALLVAGAYGGLGRFGGAAARSRLAPQSLRRAASRERLARQAETGLIESRPYSANIINNRVQKAVDRRKIKKADALREEAHAERQQALAHPEDPAHSVHVAARKFTEANKIDPRVVSDKAITTRLDELNSLNVGIGRRNRTDVLRDVDKLVKGDRASLVTVIARGITEATPEDLRAYIGELEGAARQLAQRPEANASRLAVNEQLRRQLEKALKGEKDFDGLLAAANEYVGKGAGIEGRLVDLNMLDPLQAQRAALIPHFIRNHGYRTVDEVENPQQALPGLDPEYAAPGLDVAQSVRGPDGEQVSTAQMQEAFGGGRFVDKPAYISQSPNLNSPGQYWRFWGQVANHTPETRRLTGRATLEGFDAGPEVLRAQRAKQQMLVDIGEGWLRFNTEFAVKKKDGKIWEIEDKSRADAAAENLRQQGVDVVPVRLTPWQASDSRLRSLLDEPLVDEDAISFIGSAAMRQTLEAAIHGGEHGGGSGPWALVPRAAAKRLFEHSEKLGASAGFRWWQKINSLFRRTVLFRPSWLYGNTFEAIFRGAIEGALPFITPDYWYMRKVLDSLTPEQKAIMQERIGVGQFGFAARSNNYRPIEQLSEGKLGRVAGTVRRTPGPRHAIDAYDRVNHAWFSQINGWVENQFRTALGGKKLRQEMGQGFIDVAFPKMMRKAVEEAARGLTNTHTQVQVARMIDRAYGKYDKFSPTMRSAVVLYTPFVAWSLNSLAFVLRTLPADHPVLMSIIVASNQTSLEWRRQAGLVQSTMGLPEGTTRTKDFLQNTIPGPNGSHLRLFTRNSPFGFWQDPLGTLGKSVMPQAHGVINAAQGLDWKNDKLKDENGNEVDAIGRLLYGVQEIAGGFAPGAGQSEQIFGDPKGFWHGLRKFGDPFMWTESGEGGDEGTVISVGKGARRPSRQPASENQAIWNDIRSRRDQSHQNEMREIWDELRRGG